MSVLMRRASAIKSVSMYVKCLGLSALPTSALNYARRQYEHLPKFLYGLGSTHVCHYFLLHEILVVSHRLIFLLRVL